MWNNKKAVSPLIAAVLLIVVTVGIGAVVTGIVRNYVTENKQTVTEKASDIKCGVEVAINVPTVADALRICRANDSLSIEFTLENSGSTTIDQLQVKFFGSTAFNNTDAVFTGSNISNFQQGNTWVINVTNANVGDLQEVKIVPRVKVVGRSEYAYCTDAALTFSDVSVCT